MSKTVVFDFDKTLTIKDTNMSFFLFFGKKKKLFYLRLFIYLTFKIFQKAKIISNETLKNRGLKLFLKNIKYRVYLDYCKSFSNNIQLNDDVYMSYLEYVKQGYKIIVLTASIKDYVRFLFPEALVLGSELSFVPNTPKLSFHCYKENKIMALTNVGIDKIDVVYTDSLSDLPIVKKAKNIYLVKNKTISYCQSVSDFVQNFNN